MILCFYEEPIYITKRIVPRKARIDASQGNSGLNCLRKKHKNIDVPFFLHFFYRISIEENKNANHFDLIGFIKNQKSEYLDIINEMASPENEKRASCMLEDEIFPFFLKQRCS